MRADRRAAMLHSAGGGAVAGLTGSDDATARGVPGRGGRRLDSPDHLHDRFMLPARRPAAAVSGATSTVSEIVIGLFTAFVATYVVLTLSARSCAAPACISSRRGSAARDAIAGRILMLRGPTARV